jgi:hypothetical protein
LHLGGGVNNSLTQRVDGLRIPRNMKRLLLFLVTLGATSLLAQNPPPVAQLNKNETGARSPQQLADLVSQAVVAEPSRAPAIVRQALQPFQAVSGNLTDEDQKRVAAIVAAATGSAPESLRNAILAVAAGTVPAFGAVVAEAARSVPSSNVQPALSGADGTTLLGNIRVLQVQGNNVECVDTQGKTAKLKQGQFLRQGVRVLTGAKSSAVLIFENGSLVRVNPGSEFSIEKFTQDAFNPEGLDYRTMEGEPSRSITRTGLVRGEISFDVAKLKKNSTYEIVTPVGVAGIRGTGGFVRYTSQQSGFGLYEGSVTVTMPNGQVQTVNPNQSIAVGGAGTNFAITPNPAGGAGAINQAQQSMSEAQTATTVQPFLGAPPPQSAPPDPMSNLSPAQQQALQQAAAEGTQAVAETAQQLAAASPEAAAEIAAAAANLAPAAAAAIARGIATILPAQAVVVSAVVSVSVPVQASSIAAVVSIALPAQALSISSAVATVVPSQAGSIAAAVSIAIPTQAAAVAASVATAVPAQAAAVAGAVAIVVPSQAATIASSVASAVPDQAPGIAGAVASAVPAEAAAISKAVAEAVPNQAAAVNTAVNTAVANTQGGDVGTVTTPTGPAPNQNPAALTTPTPTPPPVSPSF